MTKRKINEIFFIIIQITEAENKSVQMYFDSVMCVELACGARFVRV